MADIQNCGVNGTKRSEQGGYYIKTVGNIH